MELKQRKIAVILSTGSLKNDDRVRKEVVTLIEEGCNTVDIFAKVKNNESVKGITDYGAHFELLHLKTRDFLPSAKGLILKIFEMYFKLRKKLREYDIIWCADEGMFIFPLMLSRKRYVIWDLHEIPSMFDSNKFTRRFFKYVANKCTLVIHANRYRLEYLIQQNMIRDINKHIYINNFPDVSFVNTCIVPDSLNDIQNWLNGKSYAYLQGVNDSGRYPYNSIAAILKSTDYKIIITADKFEKAIEDELIDEFNDEYKSRVFFTGMLDQLYTPSIIKNAKFSLVFYKSNNPNNRYCEANRFYQPIAFGVPLICGNNEPMRDIIKEHNNGIFIESDGSDLNQIIEAIKILCMNYEYYRKNTEAICKKFIWHNSDVFNMLNRKIIG